MQRVGNCEELSCPRPEGTRRTEEINNATLARTASTMTLFKKVGNSFIVTFETKEEKNVGQDLYVSS